MTTRILLPDLDADAAGPPSGSVSQHELRRFLAGELTSERRAQIESEPSLQPRLEALAAELRADQAAFQLEVPLPRFLADHAQRTATAPGWFGAALARLGSGRPAVGRWSMGAGAFAAAACALFLIVRAPADEDPIRSKGGRVGFLIRESEGARFGIDGEQLASGAQIQFAVRDDSKRAAMVMVGVDGRGVVTTYAAERVDERVKGPSAPEKTRLLPDSVVLDDATGAERFFVVYGDGDVDDVRREVEAAAHALASTRASLVDTERLSLPARYTQSSVHIVKVPDR